MAIELAKKGIVLWIIMIEIENLIFEYPEKKVINNLSLSIKKGEFVTILGENGSGKSTLAKLFNGLLTPKEGTVLIDGMNTKDEEKLFNIRKTCGMVFQNPDNQIIATTVREDIAFGLENLGVPVSEMEKRIEEALEAVNLSGFGEKLPSNLSGGQKQRVAIAGTIAMKPSIIVFDEPTAMLDPNGRKAVLEIINRLKEEGKTIILITHFMEEAIKADRIIILKNGELALEGKPIEVFSEVEKVESLGLSVPTVALLCHKLKLPITLDLDEFLNLIKNEFSSGLLEESIKENTNLSNEQYLKLSQMQIVIEAENLTHIYSPKTVFEKISIQNINMQIKKGDFLGIIGHTGSGKSTLIQHFNALLKATEGCVLAFGEDILKETSIRQKVGLVFQYPEYQLFETTVFADVAYGPKNMGLSNEEIEKRVKLALSQVELGEEFYEKSPFELSGGQKRRVAIAGILSMQPEILVLDEPTAGLDPAAKEAVLKQIQKLHEQGTTIIIVSHSMEDIAKLTNKVVVLEAGKIKYDDTPEKVFENVKELEKIGLSVPVFCKIAKALNIKPNIFTIEDMALKLGISKNSL
ncbi:MAG: energy-coupling factor transporter ATPase [Defluviitaleaceae bacterium]|nr:energy-coupling factor transporter ATPase [Defluviitaleaceae bacterium]